MTGSYERLDAFHLPWFQWSKPRLTMYAEYSAHFACEPRVAFQSFSSPELCPPNHKGPVINGKCATRMLMRLFPVLPYAYFCE